MTIHKSGENDFPSSPEDSRDPPRPRLIAVIDDDALVLEATEELLRSWGYQVLTANSDRSALATFGEHDRRPDLIISDYRLSNGKNGIDVIGQLRMAFRTPIPTVIISADTLPERLRELRASGHHLLYKPVAPTTLRTVLEKLLNM
jgi:CheY-like chemotaxis protein